MIRTLLGSPFRMFGAGLLLSSAPAALAATPEPASVAALVKAVDIPYTKFVLPNGLTVIVHEDHKAPIVAVSVWYHIGSKNEPATKTGFAHLFEHLMFNGSENANDDFFKPLESVGATDLNGTTWFDRTNYFETVPTGALDLALFLESDRMGHLLGAIDQKKLDNQRAVVQNEKRQGDNQPYGLVEYAQLDALFPAGHPYHHSTIGSMTDLNGASLADVKDWFRAHYGPNNATLVLAGDITPGQAKAAVTHWFGDIPRGPETTRPDVPVPSLKAPVDRAMHDHVATTRIYRNWVGPGLNDKDAVPLDIALDILGGLASSRFDNALVRNDKIAVSTSANLEDFENVSLIEMQANVKPGVDPKTVADRIDGIVADFLKTGPSADEVKRAATKQVAGEIAGLESVGGQEGKAVTLAEGQVYSGDPEKYRKDLAEYAAATPAQVLAAARRWLDRPAFRLTVSPGDRTPADEAMAGGAATGGTMRPNYYRSPADGGAAAPASSLAASATAAPAMEDKASTPAPPQTPPSASGADRSHFPEVKPIGDLVFPAIERATLANGIAVELARRTTVPTVRVAVSFDAGNAADPKAKLGTAALTTALLDEGTTTRTSLQIAEEQERLGASISAQSGMDTTNASLYALKANLAPSLDLLADVIQNPAFQPSEVERLRNQLLARIASEKTQPNSIAVRELPPLLYGPAHPYGVPFTGSGTEAGMKAATRDDLVAWQQAWLRPDNAKIFVAGDITMAELKPLLEARFGTWRAPAGAKGAKVFRMDRMARPSRILLIDRPQSPQSLILAGALLPAKGTDDPLDVMTANEVLGGSFLSRLNMDLRETKGWAYGVGSQVRMVKETVPFFIYAPVQADKTGPSIAAMIADMNDFLTKNGISEEERARTINNQIRSLPGSFETSSDLLGALMRLDTYRRPDDYYTKLPARYRAFTAAQLDAAIRKAVDPKTLIWIVVGDAAKVRPQLGAIGLPIEEVKPGS